LKEQLTPEEFLIYEMKYVKKLSNAEIATKIGVEENAANVRISRLKNKMTKILNEM
jgi:DNA-directed RNA polymerase specialized sigma24 family protein